MLIFYIVVTFSLLLLHFGLLVYSLICPNSCTIFSNRHFFPLAQSGFFEIFDGYEIFDGVLKNKVFSVSSGEKSLRVICFSLVILSYYSLLSNAGNMTKSKSPLNKIWTKLQSSQRPINEAVAKLIREHRSKVLRLLAKTRSVIELTK